MKYHKIILSLVFAMGHLVALSQTPTSVFITAGQSNAEGRELSVNKPAYLNKGYKHLKYAFIRSAQTGKFGKYKFGETFAFCDVTNYFIDKALNTDFYSIKCTYGGTSITPGQYKKEEEAWKPVWYADSTWIAHNKAHNSKDGGLSLSLSLTYGFEKCVEQTLGKLKNGYDVKAIMWHQGESDRKKPDEYYKNFKDMITFIRERIYSVTGKEKDKTLPFIFGTVPHASRQYSAVVEAAQLRVAKELPNVYPIDFSNIPLKEDVLHFNGVGTECAGKLMFNKLVELGLVNAEAVDVDNENAFRIYENSTVTISCDTAAAPVISSAFEMFAQDLNNVLSCKLATKADDSQIIATVVNPSIKRYLNDKQWDTLANSREAFVLKVLPSGKLLIVGSDNHGIAYGLLELSRLIGVSPWEWWADATPEKKDRFELPADYSDCQAPSVEYRGIFINDEDWGLMPWSSKTMEPNNKRGVIGPKTTEKIFELLLRLRANTYWPPMHECSEPFFLTPGNREVAKKYGIYIGGSHCEPMASSTAVEWGRRGKGEYDYVNNSDNVLRFWEDRVKDVAGQEIIYTLGMRGVHDGAMNGAKTIEEQKNVLAKVFSSQRSLLSKYVNKDVTKIPQVFIPYKEILDVYNAGLTVPEDVTLMWCDDNYGYIRHFPTEQERQRKGGNGIYYHVSYWGRPHDYLWLGTFSPYLLFQQMNEAYNRGIQKMWILNVGDIKPAEYQIELFMDMAWNIDAVRSEGVQAHMNNFMTREFGADNAKALLPVMDEHYHLAFIRRPEFLGNTRCEEYGPEAKKWETVSDLPWSDKYISERIKEYQQLSDKAEKINKNIDSSRLDTYFQLVKYPVQAAAEMNKKMLYGQLARHGKANWDVSKQAFDSIAALTAIYNKGINNGGKWNGIMDFQPRKQPVFEPLTKVPAYPEKALPQYSIIEAASFVEGNPLLHYGLGHSGKAVEIKENTSLTYDLGHLSADSIKLKFNFLPVHPIDTNRGLKFSVSIDNGKEYSLDYATQGRSEEWKENILNNMASREISLPIDKKTKKHKLTIKALTEGVIFDDLFIQKIH